MKVLGFSGKTEGFGSRQVWQNSLMEKRDEDLIQELSQGHDEALELLFLRYKKPILNFSLRMLGNRADAEDVTAEVFMVLYTKHSLYKPTAKFSTWLFAVARNASIDKIRKRKKTFSIWFKKDDNSQEEWSIEDSQDLPSETAIKNEEKVLVKKAIKQLPEEQREALILREYHQMSYSEISEILTCSLEQVKILIYRGREKLKAIYPSLTSEDNHE